MQVFRRGSGTHFCGPPQGAPGHVGLLDAHGGQFWPPSGFPGILSEGPFVLGLARATRLNRGIEVTEVAGITSGTRVAEVTEVTEATKVA